MTIMGNTKHMSGRWKRTFLAATMLGATLIASQAQAKTLVIARDMDINSLDIHRTWCDTCQIFNSSVYEGLVTLDADNKVVPVIAESWTTNADQSEFTFKLNPKATFADGSKVEAKDVKWSFERLKNIKGNASGLAETLASVETPDESTVVIKTIGPNSEFLNVASSSYYGIINSDLAMAEGKATAAADADQSDTSEAWFLANSAGAGPYVLQSYEPKAELRLKANENYWRAKPDVDEVVFRQVGSAVSQSQQLESGQVDIAMQLDPETAKTVTNPDIQVDSAPSYNFIYVAIGPGALANPVKMVPEVREAISLAIDRPALLEFTLSGQGQLISTPIPIGFPGGTGHAIPEYNPEKAKELLAAAGHPDGFTLETVYPALNVYGVDFTLMMQKIQQDLAKVNIKLDLKPVEFSAWRERANGDHIPLTAVYFAPDFFGSSQYIQNFGLFEGGLWANRAGGKNDPSFLLTETKTLLADALKAPLEDAEKIWFQAGEAVKNANVILPMLSPNLIIAYNKKVSGVRNSACCVLPLSEIKLAE